MKYEFTATNGQIWTYSGPGEWHSGEEYSLCPRISHPDDFRAAADIMERWSIDRVLIVRNGETAFCHLGDRVFVFGPELSDDHIRGEIEYADREDGFSIGDTRILMDLFGIKEAHNTQQACTSHRDR